MTDVREIVGKWGRVNPDVREEWENAQGLSV